MYALIYTKMNIHTHKLVYVRTHSDAKNLKQAPDPLGRLPEGNAPNLGHYECWDSCVRDDSAYILPSFPVSALHAAQVEM